MNRPADRGSGARNPVDRLTARELREGRAEWWDDAFTALLRDAMPTGRSTIVDVGCGLGRAGETLLPLLPEAEYVGIDLDPGRVTACRRTIAPWGGRARAVVGAAEALPLGDRSVDAVLFVATLMHVPDVSAVLREARRVLRPGGRVVAAEGDNAGQQFRFGGPLRALEDAFVALVARLEALGHPRAPSIGPAIPARVRDAGFERVEVRIHAIQSLREEPLGAFLDRLGPTLDTIRDSGGLAEDDPALLRCRRALRELRAGSGNVRGFPAHVVPMWRTIGYRGDSQSAA